MKVVRPMEFKQKRCAKCGQFLVKNSAMIWYCPSCATDGLGRGLGDIDGIGLQFM